MLLNTSIHLVKYIIIAVVATNLPSVKAQQYWKRIFNAEVNGNKTPAAFIGGIENSWPEFVDIDNDGDFDLVVGSQNGKIVFLENTGAAEFATWRLSIINLIGYSGDFIQTKKLVLLR